MKTHGVDLDKTTATYDTWKGPEHIGEPIPLMQVRIAAWFANGDAVDVFTARMHPSHGDEETAAAEVAIRAWYMKVFGQEPREVTCEKNPKWDDIWDDKTVQVVPNTGERADGVKDVDVTLEKVDGIGEFLGDVEVVP